MPPRGLGVDGVLILLWIVYHVVFFTVHFDNLCGTIRLWMINGMRHILEDANPFWLGH